MVRAHRGRASPEVLGQRLLHSYREVVGRTGIGDVEDLTVRDLGVAPGGFRAELVNGGGARFCNQCPVFDQLEVPGFQEVGAVLAGGDPFQEGVALLEHTAQAA